MRTEHLASLVEAADPRNDVDPMRHWDAIDELRLLGPILGHFLVAALWIAEEAAQATFDEYEVQQSARELLRRFAEVAE